VATTKKAPTKVTTKAAPKPRAKPKRAAATPAQTITIPPHVDDELATVWHAFKGGADIDTRE
jgi:hypothetical protein